VDLLWQKRTEAKKRAVQLTAVSGSNKEEKAERVPQPKTAESSATSVVYGFSDPTNSLLVDHYRNPWGFLRVGRLLEDLDALAGTIAFEHCRVDDPLVLDQHLVTASVDRIRYTHRPNLKDDIKLSGQVTWVGRSSMEILMRASPHGPLGRSWSHTSLSLLQIQSPAGQRKSIL